ncbi:MAG: transcriptional activator NhaR [Gammaproteobacteria bacterium]|jgi:LysR family transcriptional activator of nhaA
MINYKHLHYFWVVAKQGGIARASERLHLTPQTISGQISLLEEQLGEDLFIKSGRNLELTDTGRLALSYADEIFSLGNELEETIHNLPSDRPLVFKVGIADVVAKSIAYRLLAPALELPDPVRIVCKENDLESLLAELALHRIDLVIADGPIPPGVNVKGFNHALGESGISFMAVPALAKTLRRRFPQSLDGAPLLIPSEINLVRPRLFNWLDSLRVYPRIVGEFDDSALMKAFGQAGAGVFIVPTAIADEVAKQFRVAKVGDTEDVLEQFYAISVERRISHPAVATITETARAWLKS